MWLERCHPAPLCASEVETGLEVALFDNGEWLSRSCWANEASRKIQQDLSSGFPGRRTRRPYAEIFIHMLKMVYPSSIGLEALCWGPFQTLPYTAPHLTSCIISNVYYNKLVNTGVYSRPLSCSRKLITTQAAGVWEPQCVSVRSKYPGAYNPQMFFGSRCLIYEVWCYL